MEKFSLKGKLLFRIEFQTKCQLKPFFFNTSILKLLAQNKEDRRLIEKALDSSGLPSHKNDSISEENFKFSDFFKFYTHLVQRTEVEQVFAKL